MCYQDRKQLLCSTYLPSIVTGLIETIAAEQIQLICEEQIKLVSE